MIKRTTSVVLSLPPRTNLQNCKGERQWEEVKLTKWIKLLEGDVLESLRDVHLDDPIDLVYLMDIWTPMALPFLKNLIPKMKKGVSKLI